MFYQMVKKVQKKLAVRELVGAMKASKMAVKKHKMAILKKYINRCATLIQKLWRGHFVRKVVVTVHKRIGKFHAALAGLIKGWRVRRIMRTKEVDMRVRQIRDFENELIRGGLGDSLSQGLVMSRNNTVYKLIHLISKMQE